MFFDTDCAGVVHNLAYLRYIEMARTLLAEQLGMALQEMAQTGLYPVLLRTEIDYKKTAQLSDKLIIAGRLESVERMRFWCIFEVRHARDQSLVAHCRQSLALLQMPESRPVRLPADWAARFGHLMAAK